MEPEAGSLDKLWQQAIDAGHKGDFPGVLFLLRSLAEKGVWSACARIGELYETGPAGIDCDMLLAIKWYRRGVFEGDDPIAHLGLGRALFNGNGVDRDEVAAKLHFEKAFARDEAEAGVYLGLICMNERDIRRAKHCFGAASAAGYTFAHIWLGRIAIRELKLSEALRHFKKGLIETIRLYRADPGDRLLLGIVTAKTNPKARHE